MIVHTHYSLNNYLLDNKVGLVKKVSVFPSSDKNHVEIDRILMEKQLLQSEPSEDQLRQLQQDIWQSRVDIWQSGVDICQLGTTPTVGSPRGATPTVGK
jgi:hypothetical protein